MLYLILILLLIEITVCIWIIGKIDSLKEIVAKINNDIESSCYKGNLTEFRLAVEFFNKKFNSMQSEIKQRNDLKNIDKIIQTCLFAYSFFKWFSKSNPLSKKIKLLHTTK